MSKKILLLDTNYQVQNFIELKKALKHIFKDKVEVVSTWDEYIHFGSGKIKYPSILRLKSPIKRNYFNANFSRTAVVKRDKSTCQYCAKKLSASNVTIDHVLPRAQGGGTTFINCVVACQACNNKKAANTPEQCGMVLMKRPVHPVFTSIRHTADVNEFWHKDWDDFLNY